MSQDSLSEQLFGQPRVLAFRSESQKSHLERLLAEHRADLRLVLGHALELQGVLDLVALPNGAVVRSVMATWYEGLSVHIEADFKERGIRRLERRLLLRDEDKVVDNLKFITDPHFQGQGIGARIFAHQVSKAASLGLGHIFTTGVRGTNFSGYSVWPLLGYEGPLAQHKPKVASAFLQETGIELPEEVETIQDLLTIEGGFEIWEQVGDTLNLAFDLRENSRSWQVLRDYLDTRQIRLAAGW